MIETPIGPVSVVVDEAGAVVLAVDFGTRPPEQGALVREAERQLRAYFAKKLTRFDLPLGAPGTEFQHRVWSALVEIPYGTTTSYGALAQKLGTKSARGIGSANGTNPIAIVVPCHRVIGKNGDLTGYGGGLERKRWLLVHEGASLV